MEKKVGKMRRSPRDGLRLWAAASLGFVLWTAAGCAHPRAGLWPAAYGQRGITIRVYQVGMHSLVELPAESTADSATSGSGVVSWAYGERLWFYDARHGMSEGLREAVARSGGALHAIFWPAGGVVEETVADAPLRSRDPAEVKRTWEFQLTPQGLAAMHAWLERQKAPYPAIYDVGGQAYYTAAPHYWIFFTCHHFTADALWEAGVPIHSGWCLLPAGLWWQLDRLGRRLPDAAH